MADTPPEDIIPGKDKVRGVTHTHNINTTNYQSKKHSNNYMSAKYIQQFDAVVHGKNTSEGDEEGE